jgi:hypothetical protein
VLKSAMRADLTGVVIRKEVDMEDFFKRYHLEPLVRTNKLDAGERVLQKVRRSDSLVHLTVS